MTQAFGTSSTLCFAQYLAMISYGIGIEDHDARSLLQDDGFYDWLGDDFDYFVENLFDDFLNEVESDLLTVWSTNRSEQESQ